MRQKPCDELLYPFVAWNSKKGVNSVSLEAEACPQQNEITDVRPQGNHALAFVESRFEVFFALNVDDLCRVLIVGKLQPAIQ